MFDFTDNDFRKFCERAAVPTALVLSLSASLSTILDSYKDHGLLVLAFAGAGIAALWTVYVFMQKTPARVDPNLTLPRYSRVTRFSAVGILLATGIASVWVALPSRPYSLPKVLLGVNNRSDEPIAMVSEVEFYITLPLSEFVETQVASGKLKLSDQSGESNSDLLATAKKLTTVDGEFLAPMAYRSLYELATANILFVWHTKSGSTLRAGPLPFKKDWLVAEIIVFEFIARPVARVKPEPERFVATVLPDSKPYVMEYRGTLPKEAVFGLPFPAGTRVGQLNEQLHVSKGYNRDNGTSYEIGDEAAYRVYRVSHKSSSSFGYSVAPGSTLHYRLSWAGNVTPGIALVIGDAIQPLKITSEREVTGTMFVPYTQPESLKVGSMEIKFEDPDGKKRVPVFVFIDLPPTIWKLEMRDDPPN